MIISNLSGIILLTIPLTKPYTNYFNTNTQLIIENVVIIPFTIFIGFKKLGCYLIAKAMIMYAFKNDVL